MDQRTRVLLVGGFVLLAIVVGGIRLVGEGVLHGVRRARLFERFRSLR